MPNANRYLSDEDVVRVYAALSSKIHDHFGITEATKIFRSAGLLPIGTHKHWQPLLGQFDEQFRSHALEDKNRIVRILYQPA
jgi:hemerythrin